MLDLGGDKFGRTLELGAHLLAYLFAMDFVCSEFTSVLVHAVIGP